MISVVFCDLDSTLADTRHRWHMILRGEERHLTDWEAYSMACADDGLIVSTARLLKMARERVGGAMIVLVSGRSESARWQTEAWLKKQDIDYDELVLRPQGNTLDNVMFKWLEVVAWLEAHPAVALSDCLMIDDWPGVRDHFEDGGIATVLVTPYEMTGDLA